MRTPDDRAGHTMKVVMIDASGSEFEGYITLTFGEDRYLPHDVFIHGFGQLGSTMNEWVDCFAIFLSLYFQHRGDVVELARVFQYKRFQPNGITDSNHVPECLSIPDFVLRYIAKIFRHNGLLALYAQETE